MAELHLAADFAIPADAVTQTFAILAKRGVGKTYCASVLVEELLKAGLHAVVVDPIGVWWGLRASADGTRPGLPIVILGGDHGDVPLTVTADQVIADLIVDERISVVLDLAHFRKGEQVRFMTDFAERLYHRNREPLHLVLDEADSFAPQRPMKGQERMLGAVEDLVRRGRARGIGVTLVTQRSAVLNKDVRTQAEVLVALRTIAPQDRDAIDAWIKVHGTPAQREELMTSLPSLPIGTAWFWSPGWLDVFRRVEVRKRETFDSSATPTVGQRPRTPRQLAEVDIARLRERIAATIEKAKAEDPRELKRRIAELEKQLVSRAPAPKVEKVVERVEVPVIGDEQIARLEQAARALAEVGTQLLATAQEIAAALARVTAAPAPRKVTAATALARPARADPAPPVAAPTNGSASAEAGGTVREPSLRAGERRMLQVLARHYPMKVTRAQLGTLSKFTHTGGTFGAYFSTLKRNGLIKETDGEVQITRVGLDYLGADVPPRPQTTEELLELWRSVLRTGERKMLDELVALYPQALTREELGERAGYTASGGTFGAYLSTLRRNGLVEVDGDEVRANETLFLSRAVS
ncbi:MAG TPA: DUF87 domain-containing protein [Roseiflexaceae bacterium]